MAYATGPERAPVSVRTPRHAAAFARKRAPWTAVAAALLGTLLAAPAIGQEDDREHATLLVAAERGFGYVGEVLRVRVRFGFETGFLRERMIQPFRRRLDVPAQLDAAWLAVDPVFPAALGARVLEPESAGTTGDATVAVGDAVREARRLPMDLGDVGAGGATFEMFEIERAFVCDAPGELNLEGPVLRYAFASTFTETLTGPRAEDRADRELRGDHLRIEVRPLPDGAPAGFTGAVGAFTVTANATPTSLAAGESLRLFVEIAREDDTSLDDLGAFAAPALETLDGFAGFVHRGHVERADGGVRLIEYDLAPRAGAELTEIPPIEFAFFDPRRGAWDVARTAPIPLVVRGTPNIVGIDGAAEDGSLDERADDDDDPSGVPIAVLIGAALAVVLIGAFVLARASRD